MVKTDMGNAGRYGAGISAHFIFSGTGSGITGEKFAVQRVDFCSNRGTINTEVVFTRSERPNRRIGSDGQQIIDKPTYQRLTRDFIRYGGIIQNDQEAMEHLQNRHVRAEYMPSFNVILLSDEPTVSDVLEEVYHAEQDSLHMFGEYVTSEVLLRREIDAQHYLLSMTEKYKIPNEEVELTKINLADYERQLEELLKTQGGE